MLASSGSRRSQKRKGRLEARQKPQKLPKHSRSAVSQLARRACAQQLPQDQAQIERAHMHQLPFQNVFPSPQMAAPHPARLVAVRETALDEFAAPQGLKPDSFRLLNAALKHRSFTLG